MPEGPSLVILKEQTAPFVGQEIVRAEGNTWAIDTTRLVGQPVVALRTWGKHFLIQMPEMVVRIHFLLFGTYRVNGNDLTLSWVNGNFDLTWVWKIVSDRELQAPFSYQGSDLATKTTVATFRK